MQKNKMNEPEYIDPIILSIFVIFGLFITFGYATLHSKYSINELWSNRGNNVLNSNKFLKKVYTFMIIISFVFGIYLVYYLSSIKKNELVSSLIYTGSVFFLVFSTIWAFKPFWNSKLVLSIVAIGAILLLTGICVDEDQDFNPKKIAAITATCVLVIQTGVFDLLIWNGIV